MATTPTRPRCASESSLARSAASRLHTAVIVVALPQKARRLRKPAVAGSATVPENCAGADADWATTAAADELLLTAGAVTSAIAAWDHTKKKTTTHAAKRIRNPLIGSVGSAHAVLAGPIAAANCLAL